MTILSILNQLSKTASKNDKIAILEANKADTVLQSVIHGALDPQVNFFCKRTPEGPGTGPNADLQAAIDALHSNLASRELTGGNAIQFLKDMQGYLDADTFEVVRRVVDRDLRCGVNEGTVSKVWPDLIPAFNVMLSEPMTDKLRESVTFPVLAQTKMDAMRGMPIVKGGKVKYFTRNGNLLNINNEALDADILQIADGKDCVMDGELIVVDEQGAYLPRKTSNGIVNKATPNKDSMSDDERERVHFVVWDMVAYADWTKGFSNVPTFDRFEALAKGVSGAVLSRVKLCHSDMCSDWKSVDACMQKEIQRGGEGIIIKQQGPWEAKRSKLSIKMKRLLEADLRATAVLEGTKKNKGRTGSVTMEDESGSVVANVSGMSDKERDEYWAKPSQVIGAIFAVEYEYVIMDTKTGKKSLYSPRIVERRIDKTIADDLSDAEYI